MLYELAIFVKNTGMRTSSARIQTAFRLDLALVERLRRQAKREHKTLNGYVESILLNAVQPELPKIGESYHISEETLRLSGFIPAFTREQLENDERLAYILGK